MTSIAIDGPAGSGKSTVAKVLAEQLGYTYIDTGAMYRACTLKILEEGIAPQQEEDVVAAVRDLDIRLVGPPGQQKVFLGDREVTGAIRTPDVSRLVSRVSSHPRLRALLVDKQREMASRSNVIMDGRDIGSTVLQDARYKFFLTATLEERARRRMQELAGMGHETTLDDLMEDIAQRDREDSTREASPLRRADDAVLIDTTDLDVNGVVAKIRSILNKSERSC